MDENNSFLDKNTLLAIALSMIFFLGWQAYLQKKYPDAYKTETVDKTNPAETGKIDPSKAIVGNTAAADDGTDDFVPNDGVASVEASASKKAQTFEIDNESWKISLSSKGMGLQQVELKKYSDREDVNIRFVDPSGVAANFATYYKGQPVDFSIEQKSETHFVGTGEIESQVLIKEIHLNPDNYTLAVSLKTLSGQAVSNEVIETKIANQALKVKSSMFTPAYEGTEFFSINDGSEERERIDIESPYQASFDKTPLTSIGSQYFAVALHDNSQVIPKTKLVFNPENQGAYASVFHQEATIGNKTDIQFTGFVGPKKYDILKTLDPLFEKMINYGMFSILSKPMLSMLKWLNGMFQNWGLAIILLTVFIRMLLLPINLSSLKSMKKMQKLQPQLKAIKEKYKDDPQKVNQETMALMKKEKANPLGGCLPMLLQLPVFFALYSVLGQSVELYKSPFIFWIQDLSYQDPFFVLPIAVGGLYFIQMSITPQPTDPTQAKMMKFIPLLFCFFMITVPSGLTLYFFVNTVFGIGQSFIFQREKKKAAA